MTVEQQNDVLVKIESIKKINIEKKISEIYPEQDNLGSIVISKMTVLEFVNLAKRILTQIENEINGENRVILPITFTSGDLGQGNLSQVLTNLDTRINSKQFSQAETSLLWLAQYCLSCGFYDKSKYRLHSTSSLSFEKQKTNLDLISSNYEQLIAKYNELLNSLEKGVRKLDSLYESKLSELQQITNNLDSTNTNNSQIQSLLNSSTQSNTMITSLAEQAKKDKENIESIKINIDNTYVEFEERFRNLTTEILKSDEKFKNMNNDFEEKMRLVNNKTSYFDERNEYLDNLIGREVGASLFETFKQRKGELQNPLNWWRIAVVAISILTFGVILAIFTNFFGLFGEISEALKWQNVVANTVKSAPIFFLLYFSITQYNKERSYQEEYAFKSATALTIKAYADILNDETKQDELVLKAVLGIYKSPVHNKMRSNKEVNSTLDMLSEMIGKGVELVKK